MTPPPRLLRSLAPAAALLLAAWLPAHLARAASAPTSAAAAHATHSPALAPAATPSPLPASASPLVPPDLVFSEQGGLVAVEAEHFSKQEHTSKRAWHRFTAADRPAIPPDTDGTHVAGASGGAYVEVLPDTRWTHDEKLIKGDNFTEEAGTMAVLSYRVHFSTPGRYHFWVRAFSTGTEDNGLHVGLDGKWPESGRRWQTTKKNAWEWDSRQRTEQVHTGVPGQLFLDVPSAGEHTVHIAMREDGIEIDKWLMTTDPKYTPSGTGPAPRVKTGTPPPAFAVPASYQEAPAPTKPAPASPKSGKAAKAAASPAKASAPGQVAAANTSGLSAKTATPGHSSTASKAAAPGSFDSSGLHLRNAPPQGAPVLLAASLPVAGTNFYVDRDRWLAMNPEKHKSASIKATVPIGNARFHVKLQGVGESDGRSRYEVFIGCRRLGEFVCPVAGLTFEETELYSHTWKNVEINEGELIEIRAHVGSVDGLEFSRGRWAWVAFIPVDQDPGKAPSTAPSPSTAAKTTATGAAAAAPSLSTASSDGADATAAGSPAPGTLLPRPDDEATLVGSRRPDGDGSVAVSGELKQWHKVTVDLAGPFAHELDQAVNPFADYRCTVVFTHASGAPVYSVPGYFAADGRAGESGADSGNVWRAHLAPDRPGAWSFLVRFVKGRGAAHDPSVGEPLAPFDGRRGSFVVAPTDKSGRDFRAHGRLQYVGGHFLRHAGSGDFFLKAGADAPETFLACSDFDNTVALRKNVPLKTWAPHLRDWRPGDPSWRGDRGKGIVGSLNYLADKGANCISFLTYNAGGDGDNVWPYVERDNKYHFDCSKLDQWGVVFDHAQQLGIYLHFKLQENELDDHRAGANKKPKFIPEAMDAGATGPERRLYFREIVARFGHALALNWNFGEENTQSNEEQVAMFDFMANLDPYGHHRVIHTFPQQQELVYPTLLGFQSNLTGASLQNSWQGAHQYTLKWLRASAAAGRPWVCANDEQNPAGLGVPPDPGYEGFEGKATEGGRAYDLHDIRKYTLWGTLLAGGAGVEYYFGYRLPQNDLVCEDFRSRDRSWDYCRIALDFMRSEKIPFWRMACLDELIGNPTNTSERFCFAAPGELYLVYLPKGGSAELDLTGLSGSFSVRWFNPRSGGPLQKGSVNTLAGGAKGSLGSAPADPSEDWLVVVRRQ